MLLGPEWLIGSLAWELISRGVKATTSIAAAGQPSPHWQARINNRFPDEVRVHRLVDKEPQVDIVGPLEFTSEQQQAIAAYRTQLAESGRANDLHAILVDPVRFEGSPVRFHARTCDYAGVKLLRENDGRPLVLSANVVFVCRERRQIVLHRRSDKVDTYPNCLHTFGGSFIPDLPCGARKDGASLKWTARREAGEEARIDFLSSVNVPMLLASELMTGFVQLVLLGVPVKPKDLDSAVSDRLEGVVQSFSFDELPDLLFAEEWCPSGKAHVLAWLALGAPGASSRSSFGKWNADELFSLVAGED